MSTQMNNKAVIYTRFSSNNQREESIDAQIRACKEYAQRNNYVVVDTYCDSAKSGTSAEREAFQQMINDSEEGKFSYVLVHKLDRFSRDKYDSVHYKRKLRNNGIRVISALENLSDDPESIMLESVLEGMSQYYSANLSREVMKGLKENAYSCRHTGGSAPLGYDVDKATLKYVINDEEAKIVEEIFTMYTNCYGYAEMLQRLDGLGYKTKINNSFSKSSINSILKNEKYRGVYVYNRKKEFDFNRKRRPKEKPPEEVIRIEDGMPRIITDEMFYKANHMLTKNRLRSGSYNAKKPYLLSGLVVCEECGGSLCGNSRTGGKTTSMYRSYRCSSKTNKKTKACNCKEIRKEYIENYVLDELSEIIFNEDSIKVLLDKMNEHNKSKLASVNKQIKDCRKKLSKLDAEMENALRLVTNGSVSFDSMKDTIERLEEEKSYINSLINELEGYNNSDEITIEKLDKLIKSSKEFVLTKNIPECRKFIDSYIEKVIVGNENVMVVFNITTVDGETGEVIKHTTSITREELYKNYKYLIHENRESDDSQNIA